MMNITQTFKSFLLPFSVLFFAVSFSQNINSVTQYPLANSLYECHATTVTASLEANLETGKAVYLRYSNNNYTNSAVVKMTGSEKTYEAKIPSAFNGVGVNASYYVFTAADSGVDSDGGNAVTSAVTVNDNGGVNYVYTVLLGGATTAVPDDKFEQTLIDLGLDCTLDGNVFTSNINDVVVLDVRDKNISDLTGIKSFTNLQKLYCQNEDGDSTNDNTIANLDVSGLYNLKFFYCQNNQITDLDISGLISLQSLDTSNNPFMNKDLDVHLCPSLYYLVCKNNGLTNLNISGLTNLQTLICWDNKLTNLDVLNNPDLKYLDCDDNLFTDLNVSGLVNLKDFYCSGNLLTNLDVRGLSNLTNFQCLYNDTTTPSLTCILVDDVVAANLKTSTVDPDPNAGGAFLWYKDNTANYSHCNCNLTTTWTAADGGSWDNGAPIDGAYAAIISGDYNEEANINACSLTISNNAVVTIPSGFKVTLNAPIIVEAGSSFALSNNANLIQTNKNSINSGAISVNRNSAPLYRLDYSLWSSPVSGVQTLANFSPLTSQDPNRFYTYNTATNFYDNSLLTPTTSTFTKGKGYLIRMPNTDLASGYDEGTSTLAFPANFVGTPNNGNIPVALNYIDETHGYNLVGNPYPSTIDANAFITDNAAYIESTLYFWRKTNGSGGTAYAAYNPAGGTATFASTSSELPNGTIQVGQGFFVQAKSAAAVEAFFTNAMRLPSSSAQFFRTKSPIQKDRLWLNLTNATGVFSQALIAYVSDATIGVDKYDGKYINDSATALTSNINNVEYTIQGRPAFDQSDVVALNLKTSTAGDYTIGIDHTDGIFANGQEVYLVDSKTGTETNLKTDSYTFNAAKGTDNARFSLKYQKTLGVNAPTFDENSLTVYKNNGTLYVNSAVSAIHSIKVFDLQGKLIAEQKNVKSNTATIKISRANHQVLIVQVTSEDNSIVSKKVVN